MLLSENFLEILSNANQDFPSISGQLFSYQATTRQTRIIQGRARNGFRARWILLLCVATVMLVQILDNQFLTSDANDISSSKTVKQKMCIMMIFICILTGERYRIRAQYPQEYVSFFNGAVGVEKNYLQGNIPKILNFEFININILFYYCRHSNSTIN